MQVCRVHVKKTLAVRWCEETVARKISDVATRCIQTTKKNLVGGFNPYEKWWSSSMGRIIYPIYEMENNPNVPNNQPVLYIYIYNPHCYPFICLVLKTKKNTCAICCIQNLGCPSWFWTLQPTNGAFDPLISRVGKTRQPWPPSIKIMLPSISNLVGGIQYLPSEKCGLRQLGWWFFPTEWKVIIHSCSSHHQSEIISLLYSHYCSLIHIYRPLRWTMGLVNYFVSLAFQWRHDRAVWGHLDEH